MKLSILDVVPVISGVSAGESLRGALKFAQLGDKLGWTKSRRNCSSACSTPAAWTR